MKKRWLTNLLICLTAVAVLASIPLQGRETGSTPLSVPVDEEGCEKEVEKDLDDSSDFDSFVHLSPVDKDLLLACGNSCEDSPAVDVVHDRCYGTRGPPALGI